MGHACFRLRNAAGVNVITDPYDDTLKMTPASRLTNEVAIVTMSANRPGHGDRVRFKDQGKTLERAGEYELQGVMVRAAMTPLQADEKRQARNIAFSIAMDGITTCHLGVPRKPLTSAQIDTLGPVDVMIAPVGPAEQGVPAARAILQTAQQMGARLLIPMHADAESDAMRAFLKDGGSDATQEPSARLTVTRNNLPESLRITAMTPQLERARRR